jgi:hypothetical protein
MKYTVDEKSMLGGIGLSALVSGVGIYLLYTAMSASTTAGYLGTMITGAMLFNAGVCGVTAIGSMWVNYRAIL